MSVRDYSSDFTETTEIPAGLDPDVKTNGKALANPTDLGEWDAGEVTDLPEPRAWLLGNSFARTFMSSLLGDGAVGKTALRMLQLISLALGRSLTGEHVFQRCRVLIISLEDDRKELERRVCAVCIHYGISRSELKGWLFPAAPGRACGRIMTMGAGGKAVEGPLASKIEAVIKARNIDIVSLDPFIKSHSIEENNNTGIDEVVQVLVDLAHQYNIAVDAPHHTTKGKADPGNAGKGRGASSMKDATRLTYTLAAMSPDEASAFGIDEEKRESFIRMDSGKVNIAPPMHKAKWFRLVGVRLGNATELYPNGDEVQTVEPWKPPETWADLDTPLLNRILTAIDGGLPGGNRYSDTPRAGSPAWKVVIEHAPGKTEAQARQIIKAWVKNGVLTRKKYKNPDSKQVSGLHLDATKRPG